MGRFFFDELLSGDDDLYLQSRLRDEDIAEQERQRRQDEIEAELQRSPTGPFSPPTSSGSGFVPADSSIFHMPGSPGAIASRDRVKEMLLDTKREPDWVDRWNSYAQAALEGSKLTKGLQGWLGGVDATHLGTAPGELENAAHEQLRQLEEREGEFTKTRQFGGAALDAAAVAAAARTIFNAPMMAKAVTSRAGVTIPLAAGIGGIGSYLSDGDEKGPSAISTASAAEPTTPGGDISPKEFTGTRRSVSRSDIERLLKESGAISLHGEGDTLAPDVGRGFSRASKQIAPWNGPEERAVAQKERLVEQQYGIPREMAAEQKAIAYEDKLRKLAQDDPVTAWAQVGVQPADMKPFEEGLKQSKLTPQEQKEARRQILSAFISARSRDVALRGKRVPEHVVADLLAQLRKTGRI